MPKHPLQKCPSCGCDDIEGSSWDCADGEVWQRVTCTDCGTSWSEVYRFDRILDEDCDTVEDPATHVWSAKTL